MKELDLTIAVGHYLDEFPNEINLPVKIEDSMYEKLVAFAQECYDNETEFTEDMLEEKFPDICKFINERVDEYMPGEIELQEDEEMEDFSWYVEYPEDICEMLLDI